MYTQTWLQRWFGIAVPIAAVSVRVSAMRQKRGHESQHRQHRHDPPPHPPQPLPRRPVLCIHASPSARRAKKNNQDPQKSNKILSNVSRDSCTMFFFFRYIPFSFLATFSLSLLYSTAFCLSTLAPSIAARLPHSLFLTFSRSPHNGPRRLPPRARDKRQPTYLPTAAPPPAGVRATPPGPVGHAHTRTQPIPRRAKTV